MNRAETDAAISAAHEKAGEERAAVAEAGRSMVGHGYRVLKAKLWPGRPGDEKKMIALNAAYRACMELFADPSRLNL